MEARFASPSETDVALTDAEGTVWAVKPGDPRLEGVEVAPYEGAAAPRFIEALAFRRRFTAIERGGITLAASAAMDGGDPKLQVFLDDLAAAGRVDLDDPEVAGAMEAMVTAGLITEARKIEILA